MFLALFNNMPLCCCQLPTVFPRSQVIHLMVELRSMVASIIEARLRLSKFMLSEEEGGLAKICQDGTRVLQ